MINNWDDLFESMKAGDHSTFENSKGKFILIKIKDYTKDIKNELAEVKPVIVDIPKDKEKELQEIISRNKVLSSTKEKVKQEIDY